MTSSTLMMGYVHGRKPESQVKLAVLRQWKITSASVFGWESNLLSMQIE